MSDHTPIVEPLSTFLDHVNHRNQLVPATADGIRANDSVTAWSLVQYQTPFKNQNPRGTCWAFAAAAAMEAAYKRQYGITPDLSEEYIYHVEKTVGVGDGQGNDLPGPRETNCSYWDFQGASDVLLVLPAYGVSEEKYAPYITDVETLRQNIPAAGNLSIGGASQEQIDAFEYNQALIPLAARWNARYRVTGSKAVYTGSGDPVPAIIAELSNNREVVIGMTVGNGGDDNLGGSSGVGGHVTLIVAFDNTLQSFLIKNSWGIPLNPVTGQTTFTALSYATARQYITSAHAITSIADPNSPPDISAIWRGVWNMDHDGWRGKLVIRRTFNFENYVAKDAGQPNTLGNAQNSVRLGSYYRDGLRHDVNGHFEENGRKLVFFIADQAGSHVASGQETGQRFEVYLFSRDGATVAGQTSWQNSPFGALLSRTRTPGLPSSFTAAQWYGVWAISDDGWRGTLKIISISPSGVVAVYRAADGTEFPAPGFLGGDPHIINLTVQFSPANHQPFSLLAHTRETGVFSGTTKLSGTTYGVKGLRLLPIYGIEPNGVLLWYQHEGRVQGSTAWSGPNTVGSGWNNFQRVFSGGDGILYGVQPDGTLLWYRHVGNIDGTAAFAGPKTVGSGWENFKSVIGGGSGVVYAIQNDGSLLWYRHDGRADGSANWAGPIQVGSGWADFKQVFSAGDGILYAVKNDGTLVWYWHYGFAGGSVTWSEPMPVGEGWADFLSILAAEDGVIYAIAKDGTLSQYVHVGRYDGSRQWIGAKVVGSGWQNFTTVLVS
jgi:hypothetical protein